RRCLGARPAPASRAAGLAGAAAPSVAGPRGNHTSHGAPAAQGGPATGRLDLWRARLRPGLQLRRLLRPALPGPDRPPLPPPLPGGLNMTDLWQPRSTCGYDCLPAAVPASLAGALMVLRRLVATAVVLLVGGVALPLLAALPRNRLLAVQRAFARAVLRALGIRHRVMGRLPDRRALLVANHASWIDTLMVLAHTSACLLAKHDVRDWPIIGRVARALGTVFVDRTRPKALPATVRQVADLLAEGGVVAVFPEGTTWCGQTGGRF